jgi:c-di-GMP-binding flagellar brake protein YcgR
VEQGLHIDAIEERFLVHGRMEILALLNELIYLHEPISVQFGTERCIETRLLEARDQTLVFEFSDDKQANEQLALASGCTFLANPQGIRVLFAAGPVEPISWGGSAAFSVPLPAKLARLQRQESFRTIVPLAQAAGVTLYDEAGAPLGQWPLRDLSVGGIGVAMPSQAELDYAATAKRVRVALPQYGEIDCAVGVRHATGLEQPDGECSYRIGLGFIDLPEPMRVAILRYIVDVEQARRDAPLSDQAED